MGSHDRGFLQWGQSKLILIFSSGLLSLYSGVPKSYLTHLCVCVFMTYIFGKKNIWKHSSASLLLLGLCFEIISFSKTDYIDGKLFSTPWEVQTEVNKKKKVGHHQEASVLRCMNFTS